MKDHQLRRQELLDNVVDDTVKYGSVLGFHREETRAMFVSAVPALGGEWKFTADRKRAIRLNPHWAGEYARLRRGIGDGAMFSEGCR